MELHEAKTSVKSSIINLLDAAGYIILYGAIISGIIGTGKKISYIDIIVAGFFTFFAIVLINLLGYFIRKYIKS